MPLAAMPRSLVAGILHGEYMKSCAEMERIGVPLDVPMLRSFMQHWDDIRIGLAGGSIDRYPVFDGLHFSHEKFERFLFSHGLDKAWPRTEKSKARSQDEETWKEMAALHPELEPLRQLVKTIKMPKLNIACDADGRNRVLLGAFGTITSRNAPSGSDESGTFIFAPAKWVRFLIKPPEGWALAYIDWSSQEYGIGAILSGDRNMLRAYEEGDPYMAFAILSGAAPPGATKGTHPAVRKLYKSATLAIGYGQTVGGFNQKTKLGMAVAQRVFNDYRRVFATYCAWRERQVDEYGISLRLSTKLGWTLHHGERVKPNTLVNFAAQAHGAEMLRLAVIEMQRRGVQVCCPVHDAVLVQARAHEIGGAVEEAKAAMAAASSAILGGYVLRSEHHCFPCSDADCHSAYKSRYHDDDGEEMWKKVSAKVIF